MTTTEPMQTLVSIELLRKQIYSLAKTIPKPVKRVATDKDALDFLLDDIHRLQGRLWQVSKDSSTLQKLVAQQCLDD